MSWKHLSLDGKLKSKSYSIWSSMVRKRSKVFRKTSTASVKKVATTGI